MKRPYIIAAIVFAALAGAWHFWLGARWTMHWLEAADHSFHAPKSSRRSDDEILDEVAAAVGIWLSPTVAP